MGRRRGLFSGFIYSFGAKRIMRKDWWMMGLAALTVLSCSMEGVSRRPEGNREDVWQGPGMNVGSKEVCYITCFDYPDGYDWRTDPQKGSVKCSLVVFADGLPMMKVPVGDTCQVSPDPDRHRIIDGHLYTDYCTGTEMVIKRDGKTILRYPGCENICGMLVKDDSLYTLGHQNQGEGFVYRRNGRVILERPSGGTFGRLHCDAGHICFAFTEPIISEKETFERYYHCMEEDVTQTALRDDIKKVWDIISYNGEVCYIASLKGVEKPVLFLGGAMNAMVMPEGAEPLSFRMMAGEDHLFWEGLFIASDNTVASALWFSPERCIAFEEGMVANSCFVSGDGICCAFNPAALGGVIYRAGEEFAMPAGYAAMGPCCGAMVNGILHVGLSSLDGGCPKVWKDGKLDPLDICGYIASVSAY